MKFEIKSDLPIANQVEIDRISAIDSAFRTTAEAAILTSRLPYLTNKIIASDAQGLILQASGLTVPTGYEGFTKGATFVKTDASGNGLYINTGTSTSAVWSLVDEDSFTLTKALTSADLKAMFGNPVEVIPGVTGKTIIVESVVLNFTPGAVAYTGGGDIVVGSADADCITDIPKALILSIATDTPLCSIAKGKDLSAYEAQGLPIAISNKDAAFATGTVDASLTIHYHLA